MGPARGTVRHRAREPSAHLDFDLRMHIHESDFQPGVFFLMAGDAEETALLKTRHRARAEAYRAALETVAEDIRRALELAARLRSRARYLTDDWEDRAEREQMRAQASEVRDLLLDLLAPAREAADLPPLSAGQVARWLW
jgi:hypothetical protein